MQSPELLQPQAPDRQRFPSVLVAAVQSAQIPVEPQASAAVPTMQVPLVAAEQQPDGQGVLESQAKVQRPVVVSQDVALAGQWVVLVHPHCPPPDTATQRLPAVPAANSAGQSEQAPPSVPHVAAAVPGTQLPLSQQPPLQVWVALQEMVQVLLVVSQALPAGQSAAVLQPQAPLARQTVPLALLTQLPQTVWPVSAQRAEVSPGSQVPAVVAEQQPPLHGCVELQAVPQVLVVVSQALPVGQSPTVLQPQLPLMHWPPAAAPVQSVQAPPARPQAELLIAAHWFDESQQ
jgi:hypothetical protein